MQKLKFYAFYQTLSYSLPQLSRVSNLIEWISCGDPE